MGFWSPQSLLADAKRHGVVVHRPDVNASAVGARPVASDPEPPTIRLGLASVRAVGDETAERLVAGQPWSSQEDLVRRGGLTRPQLEALALAGALDRLVDDRSASVQSVVADESARRRRLVWTAGAAAQSTSGHLPGIVTGANSPPLPAPSPLEAIADDLWAIGVTPERTAIELVRPTLARRGVVPARTLPTWTGAGRVTVAGVVTHRQQPETAGGAVFLNLEDETGLVNVVCSRGGWVRWRSVARTSPALVVRGRLERSDGVVNVLAERFEPLPLGPAAGVSGLPLIGRPEPRLFVRCSLAPGARDAGLFEDRRADTNGPPGRVGDPLTGTVGLGDLRELFLQSGQVDGLVRLGQLGLEVPLLLHQMQPVQRAGGRQLLLDRPSASSGSTPSSDDGPGAVWWIPGPRGTPEQLGLPHAPLPKPLCGRRSSLRPCEAFSWSHWWSP